MPPTADAPPVPPLAAAHAAEQRVGLALAGGAAILFGTSYIATKAALVSFSPIAIGAWRGVGALLLTLVVLAVREPASLRPPADRGRLLRLAALGSLAGPGLVVGMNLAVSAMGATVAAFVAGLYAVIAAMLAPVVLAERLSPGAIAGFATALAGTALLAELDPASASLGGIAAGLGGAVSYALYLVLSRRWGRLPGGLASPGTISLAIFVATSAILLPLGLLEGIELVPPAVEPEAIIAIAWLAAFPSVLANLMILGSVRRVAARRSSSLLLLNPVSAAVMAAFLFGERLSPPQLAGAGLVIAGIAISNGLVRLPVGPRGAA